MYNVHVCLYIYIDIYMSINMTYGDNQPIDTKKICQNTRTQSPVR